MVTHMKVTLHVQYLITTALTARKRHNQDRPSWQRIDGIEVLIEFDYVKRFQVKLLCDSENSLTRAGEVLSTYMTNSLSRQGVTGVGTETVGATNCET